MNTNELYPEVKALAAGVTLSDLNRKLGQVNNVIQMLDESLIERFNEVKKLVTNESNKLVDKINSTSSSITQSINSNNQHIGSEFGSFNTLIENKSTLLLDKMEDVHDRINQIHRSIVGDSEEAPEPVFADTGMM